MLDFTSLVSDLRLSSRLRREIHRNHGRVCLVHQMGKVGSSSVYSSLRDSLPLPVYHTHFLSRQGIRNAELFFRSAGASVPYNIRFSKVLRRLLPDMYPIIVTLVRDPIAREISNYFQIGERVFAALRTESKERPSASEAIVQEVSAQIQKLRRPDHHVHTWFDNELRSVFDVDVYSTPFSYERGFVLIRGVKAIVLLFRLEDLGRSFECGVQEAFESSDNFTLVVRNRSESKEYADLYRFVKRRISIPPEVCEAIYQTRYGRHFYGDMAAELTQKWSNKRVEEAGDVCGVRIDN